LKPEEYIDNLLQQKNSRQSEVNCWSHASFSIGSLKFQGTVPDFVTPCLLSGMHFMDYAKPVDCTDTIHYRFSYRCRMRVNKSASNGAGNAPRREYSGPGYNSGGGSFCSPCRKP
jgi:hypothetical protein